MMFRTSLLAGVVALCASQAARADKNVLVVFIDDAGVSKISSYAGDYTGYTPAHLPNTLTIDSLASHGLRFTHAWATPECSPTRVSFMTGQHPSRTGIGKALADGAKGMDWKAWLATPTTTSTLSTIAKEFSSRGYATGLFGKSHYGTLADDGTWGTPTPPLTLTAAPNPILAGYDRFWGALDGEIGNYTSWTRIEWRKGGTGTAATETVHATKKTQQTALDWITTRTQPWFAVVAFNAPHSASSASSAWNYVDATGIETRTSSLSCLQTSNCLGTNKEVKQQIFQGLLEDVDIKLYKLLNGIDEDVLKNTLIVVAGDNGTPSVVEESIFDNGRGKGTTYETGVRVPLIVVDGEAWVTGVHGTATNSINPINQPIDAKVNTVDLYNTLLDNVFGTTNPDAQDSSSFAQCFTNSSDPKHWCNWRPKRYGYTEMYNPSTGVTNGLAAVSYGEDTMVVSWDATNNCLAHEFYDGAVDPLQTNRLYWTGSRATDLEDEFNRKHDGRVDWANPTGSSPSTITFCPL